MSAAIAALDHLVLTVADIARTGDFYTRALGMRIERAGARGPIRSINLRDPDGNLIELATPLR